MPGGGWGGMWGLHEDVKKGFAAGWDCRGCSGSCEDSTPVVFPSATDMHISCPVHFTRDWLDQEDDRMRLPRVTQFPKQWPGRVQRTKEQLGKVLYKVGMSQAINYILEHPTALTRRLCLHVVNCPIYMPTRATFTVMSETHISCQQNTLD